MKLAIGVACLLASSVAFADEVQVDVASVVRADFTTKATPIAVEQAACSLGAHAQIGGQDRPLDLRIEHQGKVVMCPVAGTNPLTIVIRIEPPLSDQFHVVASLDAPAGATPDVLNELRETVRDTAAEINRRALVAQPIPREKSPEVHYAPTRAYSTPLTVTGIVVAALGIGAAIVGYGWFATTPVSGRDIGPPIAVMLAGGGGVLLGALFAWVGEHRVPDETGK